MHSTGYFIEDKRPFSEKFWGHRTAIYIKLAKDLSASQWKNFYGALSYTGDIQGKLEEYGRPVEHWTDNPDEYFIMGSDPVEEEGSVGEEEGSVGEEEGLVGEEEGSVGEEEESAGEEEESVGEGEGSVGEEEGSSSH